MLVSLAIRDIVLIDNIELAFGSGLCVMTGETGAGKSILLDSLGLALGARADAALVRGGDGGRPAAVTAAFALDARSPVPELLVAQGLAPPGPGENLILRRVLGADGRSRAFINDQPVSVSLLRRIGESLVEIEGRFASHGLMAPATHRAALDSHGGLDDSRHEVARCHQALGRAEAAVEAAETALAKARAEESYLRHVAGELAALDPRPGEEDELAGVRAMLMHGEKLAEAMAAALTDIGGGGDGGAEARLGAARRVLAREAERTAGRFDPIIEALDRAEDAAAEAHALLQAASHELDADPRRLETVEERLFALRAAARKHDVAVDALAPLREKMEADLARLDESTGTVDRLAGTRDQARAAYLEAAETLSRHRAEAAKALDAAVAAELPPLKLDKASFRTVIEALAESEWAAHGIDRVHFEVATNPGMPPGPLARIASGGELARFLLALKVVLQRANAVPTLVFDEVDVGVGGAAAAAVGERLARLGRDIQVMVVTHSPQVAAHGVQHLRVMKSRGGAQGAGVVTTVDELTATARREEIARMLAGKRITDEARAAADSLIAAGGT